MDNPLVQPDPGLYIWTIATFLVLAGLLAKFAWKPLLAALAARQDAIRKSLDEARQARTELERLNAESQRILAQARSEAESLELDEFHVFQVPLARIEADAGIRFTNAFTSYPATQVFNSTLLLGRYLVLASPEFQLI